MKNIKRIFVGGVVGAVLSVGVAHCAAVDTTGCLDEANDYIAPELALCSTHAYNIGLTTNPDNAETKQLVREVVGLKTTLMTQQLKRQYDYLDAMLRRLKTQLQKSVLTTKLQAAGASSDNDDGGSSGGGSRNRNIVLDNATDCGYASDKVAAISCLQNNLRLIDAAISARNTGEAKRQLEKDLEAAASWQLGEIKDCGTENKATKLNSTELDKCTRSYRIALSNALSEANKPKQSVQYGLVQIPQ